MGYVQSVSMVRDKTISRLRKLTFCCRVEIGDQVLRKNGEQPIYFIPAQPKPYVPRAIASAIITKPVSAKPKPAMSAPAMAVPAVPAEKSPIVSHPENGVYGYVAGSVSLEVNV